MTTASSTVLQRLRATGLRPTVARIGVLQLIEASGSVRLCAADVLHKMMLRGTRVGTGTVYRALHQFDGAHGLSFTTRIDKHKRFPRDS